jgi:hypothetical protein
MVILIDLCRFINEDTIITVIIETNPEDSTIHPIR